MKMLTNIQRLSVHCVCSLLGPEWIVQCLGKLLRGALKSPVSVDGKLTWQKLDWVALIFLVMVELTWIQDPGFMKASN